MQDVHSRVTVVGAEHRIDVTVPSRAPIGEYVVELAQLCNPDGARSGGGDHVVTAWSLATATSPTLAPGSSLLEAGVMDGEVLYLRNLARDPSKVPAVVDVDELVVDEADRLTRVLPSRGHLLLSAGLMWLAASAVLLPAMHATSASAVAALALGAIALLVVGWGFEQTKSIRAPWPLTISCCAVPMLAAAGGLLAFALSGRVDVGWFGAVAGAGAALLVLFVAMPAVAVLAVMAPVAVAIVVSSLVTFAGLDARQGATLGTLGGFGLLLGARRVAAMLAVLARRRHDGAGLDTDTLMERTGHLMTLCLVPAVVALVPLLLQLGRSHDLWAIGLAAAIGVAAGARARRVAPPQEALAFTVVGVAGLFATLTAAFGAAADAGWPSWLAVGCGVILTAAGAGLAASGSRTVAALPGTSKRYLTDNIFVVAASLVVPVALGAAGVLSILLDQGKSLF